MNEMVSLPDDLVKAIEAQVDAGHFASAQDVVRSALELLEAQQAQPDRLRDAWNAGIASGGFAKLDLDAVKQQGRAVLDKIKSGH
jgi:putative addiction module CopG family antidote